MKQYSVTFSTTVVNRRNGDVSTVTKRISTSLPAQIESMPVQQAYDHAKHHIQQMYDVQIDEMLDIRPE